MDFGTHIRAKRDHKVQSHLEQYAPVWLTDERLVPEDDSIIFDVVFQHPLYGWVSRRYRYDGFADVLYHLGQHVLPEDVALTIIEAEPFIDTLVADIPNAYGG